MQFTGRSTVGLAYTGRLVENSKNNCKKWLCQLRFCKEKNRCAKISRMVMYRNSSGKRMGTEGLVHKELCSKKCD